MRRVSVFENILSDDQKTFTKTFMGHGRFHQWGQDFMEDYESGFTGYTVAIVEMNDGTVKKVDPELIQFAE